MNDDEYMAETGSGGELGRAEKSKANAHCPGRRLETQLTNGALPGERKGHNDHWQKDHLIEGHKGERSSI